jgi:TnpA family transposase
MAIAKLLNLDLCPRLYSLRDRHLHLPRRFEVPPAIAGIVQHAVSLEPIRDGWDDLLRTVYLCDYFTLPDFRRPLYRVLERGESVHALQRQICTQQLPAKRGRRPEELIATSGALTLLTAHQLRDGLEYAPPATRR